MRRDSGLQLVGRHREAFGVPALGACEDGEKFHH